MATIKSKKLKPHIYQYFGYYRVTPLPYGGDRELWTQAKAFVFARNQEMAFGMTTPSFKVIVD
jgi:hypothetical protein